MGIRGHQMQNLLNVLNSIPPGPSLDSISLQGVIDFLQNMNAYKPDLCQLIKDAADDMDNMEYDISSVQARMNRHASELTETKKNLDKAVSAITQMAWMMSKSCDKCKGVENFVFRVEELSRSIYLDPEEAPEGATEQE